MRLQNSSYVLIAIIVIVLAVITSSLIMPDYEVSLLPLIIGSIVLILTLIIFFRESFGRSKGMMGAAVAKGQVETSVGNLWRYLLALAWVVGFFLAVDVFGLLLAMFLLLFLYMKLHGIGWISTTIYAVITPLILYIAFELGLKIYLYRGLIFN